jgi:endonuclease G
MKKILKTLAIAVIALSIGLISACSASKQQAKPLPITEWTIEREAYSLAYDGQHKQARWVYEHLDASSVQGHVDRSKFDFQEDPLIPPLLRATKKDYAGSGFDRGHLCPAADARFDEDAMRETFYLSNISPQCPQFNRGYWAKLEKYVRELAKQYGAIHVFTGGLYLPHQENGKKYVKYQVIGENEISVPTHYFKIIFSDDGAPLESYILPNEPISSDTPLKDFMTTVEKVEKAAGFVFKNPA